MSTASYREPDDEGSLRARIAKAEADIAALQSPARRALWAGWRWLGWALLIAAACAVVLVPLGWLCFRGTTTGAPARANAEREALRWAHTRWPALAADRIYCPGRWASPCVVTDPSGVRWLVTCDDDAPKYNDGCNAPRPASAQESP